jgi:hypothetical protein
MRAAFHDGRTATAGARQASGGGADPMAFDHAAHRAVLEDFIRAVQNGAAPAVTGRSAFGVQQVIEAIMASSKNRQRGVASSGCGDSRDVAGAVLVHVPHQGFPRLLGRSAYWCLFANVERAPQGARCREAQRGVAASGFSKAFRLRPVHTQRGLAATKLVAARNLRYIWIKRIEAFCLTTTCDQTVTEEIT